MGLARRSRWLLHTADCRSSASRPEQVSVAAAVCTCHSPKPRLGACTLAANDRPDDRSLTRSPPRCWIHEDGEVSRHLPTGDQAAASRHIQQRGESAALVRWRALLPARAALCLARKGGPCGSSGSRRACGRGARSTRRVADDWPYCSRSRPASGGTDDDDRFPAHRRLQLRGRPVRGDSAARARELLPLQALPASERSGGVS